MDTMPQGAEIEVEGFDDFFEGSAAVRAALLEVFGPPTLFEPRPDWETIGRLQDQSPPSVMNYGEPERFREKRAVALGALADGLEALFNENVDLLSGNDADLTDAAHDLYLRLRSRADAETELYPRAGRGRRIDYRREAIIELTARWCAAAGHGHPTHSGYAVDAGSPATVFEVGLQAALDAGGYGPDVWRSAIKVRNANGIDAPSVRAVKKFKLIDNWLYIKD